MDDLSALADRVERYDPKLSPDNRADELALHQDVVMATGEGSLTCDFHCTFLRSLDAAMTLVPKNSLATVKQLWDVPRIVGRALVFMYEDYPHDGSHGKLRREVFKGDAATPALALTAAALRAHAYLKDNPQ